jgi:hypothetical protein
LTRRILGAGEIPEIFSKITGGPSCFEEILSSDPDLQEHVDWDREETIGKIEASPMDVITKEKYADNNILYSANGDFPILDAAGNPPENLQWQKTPHHGLVICGKSHLTNAAQDVVDSTGAQDTFEAANRELQKQQAGYKTFSQSKTWMARTALSLIRLFATLIG